MMEVEDLYKSTIEKFSRIQRIHYDRMSEVVEQLLQDQSCQYYNIIQLDKYTSIADLSLFLMRFQYLFENKEQRKYYIIINSRIEPKFLDQALKLFTKLYQEQGQQKNILILFIQQDVKCALFSTISKEIKQDEVIILNQNLLQKSVKIFHSSHPGSGKSFLIQQQIMNCEQKFRIALYGCTNKLELLQQFNSKLQNIDQNKPLHIHLDIHENLDYDLNLLLYDMIFQRTISINCNHLINLGQNTYFYIEIANTLDEELENSLFLKNYFQVNKIDFSVNKYQTQHLNQDEIKQHLICDTFLNCYFTDNYETLYDCLTSHDQKKLEDFLRSHSFHQLKKNIHIEEIQSNFESFYQMTRFFNLFGYEMQKLIKCLYLHFMASENSEEIKNINNNQFLNFQDRSQRLQLANLVKQENILIYKKIIQMSLKICLKVSLQISNNQNNLNQIAFYGNLTKEMKLAQISCSFTKFNGFLMDFITFQEQENPCVTSFFLKKIPEQLNKLFEGQNDKIILLDQHKDSNDLLRWLIRLIHKNEAKVYKNNKDNSPNSILDEYKNLQKIAQEIIISKDNFFKMAMIFMRIRSNSPVIIMGQSGIGKTFLIKFMAEVMEANFESMNIHAGVTKKDVVAFVEQHYTSQKKVVLFFDEINTSKLVGGLFKEIIVDKRLNNQDIPKNIIPIAAINPYILKSQRQKEMLEIQIYGGIKKEFQKFNQFDLEYMVEPLPQSMYNFIWNFDNLSYDDEYNYIQQILTQQNKNSVFTQNIIVKISELVLKSNQFIRKEMGYNSACSLRDVSRFKTLLFWFADFFDIFNTFNKEIKQKEKLSIYFAFFINYCIRLPLCQQRKKYMIMYFEQFQISQNDDPQLYDKVLHFFMQQLEIPSGIVINSALKINTFALFVSIINKIPVVLVGPPGSSKTLSMNILLNSIKGHSSKQSFLSKYPKLIQRFYQGHTQSTSERILEVFNQAKKDQAVYDQQGQDQQLLSVLYIDELGLAEISPHNPLKVLHSTLESPNFAIACVSNWPLDQSKMNRLLQIYRIDVDEDELIDIFECIKDHITNQSIQNCPNLNNIEKTISIQIARFYLAYLKIIKSKHTDFEQFHGLRDYYSISKLIVSKISSASFQINKKNKLEIIATSILRHFSGLNKEYQALIEAFQVSFNDNIFNYIQFSSSIELDMIKENLQENSQVSQSRNLMIISNNTQSAIVQIQQELKRQKKDYHTIIGSDFPKDQEQDNSYKAIWEIVNCAVRGKIVIVQNLDKIYQCLYELLNQNYTIINQKNLCKVSFGSSSSNVEVSPNFKLILIVDDQQIKRMDGPLINRFEKHLYDDSMIQTEDYLKLIQRVTNMLDKKEMFPFSNLNEIISSIVFQQQNMENENDIIDKIYNLTTFNHNLASNNFDFKSKYITSGYHFSLEEFALKRILHLQQQQINQRIICIYTPSSQQQFAFENEQQQINLSQIDSSSAFLFKLRQYFKQVEQDKSMNQSFYQNDLSIIDLNQDEEVIKNKDISQVNYKNILQICCDTEIDSFQRINYIRQVLTEELMSLSFKNQINVIIIIKIKENFQVLPYQIDCEQYYIEELYPKDCNIIQFNLQNILQNKNDTLLEQIQINLNAVLKSEKFIEKCYKKVKYSTVVNSEYVNKRINQLKMIFCDNDNAILDLLKQKSIKILNKKIQNILNVNNIDDIGSFIIDLVQKQFKQNKIGKLRTQIYNKLQNIIEQSLTWFIQYLEEENMINSIFENRENIDLINYIINQMEQFNQGYIFIQNDIQKDYLFPSVEEIINEINESVEELIKSHSQFYLLDSNIDQQNQQIDLFKCNQLFNEYFKNTIQHLDIYKKIMNSENLQQILYKDYIKYSFDQISNDTEVIIENILKIIKVNDNNDDPLKFLKRIFILSFHKEDILIFGEFMKKFSYFKESLQLQINYNQLYQLPPIEYNSSREYPYIKVLSYILYKEVYENLIESYEVFQVVSQKYQINLCQLIEYLKKFKKHYNLTKECKYFDMHFKIILIFRKQIDHQLQSNLLKDIIEDIKQMKDFSFNFCLLKQKLKNKINDLSDIQKRYFQLGWCSFVLESLIALQKIEDLNQSNYYYSKLIESLYSIDLSFVLKEQTQEQVVCIKAQLHKILNKSVSRIKDAQDIVQLFKQELIKEEYGIDEEENDNIFQTNELDESEIFIFNLYSFILNQKLLQSISNEQEHEQIIKLLHQNLFQNLSSYQKLVYIWILKESIDAIIQNKYKKIPLELIEFFKEINQKKLQYVIVLQLYNEFETLNNVSENLQSLYILNQCEWILPILSEKRLLYHPDFLSQQQQQYFIKYFLNTKNLSEKLREFIISQIDSTENVFKEIYEGNVREQYYYPYMMHNNIDINQLKQIQQENLYQCIICQNFILNNIKLNEESNIPCKYCGNLQQNQYVEQDIDRILSSDFNEINNQYQQSGLCFNFNNILSEEIYPIQQYVLSLIYCLTIQISYHNNNFREIPEPKVKQTQASDNSQQGIYEMIKKTFGKLFTNFTSQSNEQEEENLNCVQPQDEHIKLDKSSQKSNPLINQILKIDLKENVEQFLEQQIQLLCNYLIQSIKESFNDVSQDEEQIILFKIVYNILHYKDIQPYISTEERSNVNRKISVLVNNIISETKQIIQNLDQQKQDNILEISNNFKQNDYCFFFEQNSNSDIQINLDNLINSEQNQIIINYLQTDTVALNVFYQFNKQTLLQFNNQFDTEKAKQITLLEVLQNDKQHQLYLYYINKVIPTWNQILQKLDYITVDGRKYQLNKLNENTKLFNLLMYNDQNCGQFTLMMKYLCECFNKLYSNQQQEKSIDTAYYQLDFIQSNYKNNLNKYVIYQLLDNSKIVCYDLLYEYIKETQINNPIQIYLTDAQYFKFIMQESNVFSQKSDIHISEINQDSLIIQQYFDDSNNNQDKKRKINIFQQDTLLDLSILHHPTQNNLNELLINDFNDDVNPIYLKTHY